MRKGPGRTLLSHKYTLFKTRHALQYKKTRTKKKQKNIQFNFQIFIENNLFAGYRDVV